MSREEIIAKLQEHHMAFIHCIELMEDDQFNFAKEGKWNAGQTLDHLSRAVGALDKALMLPKFLFAGLFGKSNRPSKSYEALVMRYGEKLAAGGKAHGRYLPEKISFDSRQKACLALQKSIGRICNRLNGYSEMQLDEYILPHPLLGKITIREMMYFTCYHAEHHRRIMLRDMQELKSASS